MARNTPNSTGSARDQARRIQKEQEAKQRRTSLLLRVGVIVVALAVVVGLTVFIVNQRGGEDRMAATEGPAPAAANEQGGITLTSVAEMADGDDLGNIDASEISDPDSELPVGVEPREEGEPPHLLIYADANCVHCANFETQHAEQIKDWVDAGDVTVEYRMVGFLDGNSATNYSSRAANAMSCVADESPENYMDYVAEVIQHQTAGELSDDELVALASDSYDTDIQTCVDEGTYRAFVSYTTAQAQANEVEGTPTVYVDDEDWASSEMGFQEWAQGKIDESQSES